MDRLVAWIGKLVGTAMGGPGIVVLDDPNLDPERAAPRWPQWVYRLVGVGVALAVISLAGLPPLLLAPIAAAALLLILLERRRTRRRGRLGNS